MPESSPELSELSRRLSMRRARRSDRLRVTGARVASLPSNGKLLLPESVSAGARASGAKAGLLFFCAEFGRVDLAESRVRADDGCDDVLKKKQQKCLYVQPQLQNTMNINYLIMRKM